MFIFMFSTILYVVLAWYINPILHNAGVVKSLQKSILISILTLLITLPVSWLYDKINAPDTPSKEDAALLQSITDDKNASISSLSSENVLDQVSAKNKGEPSPVPYENIPNSDLTPEQRRAKAQAKELNEAMKNLNAYQAMQ